MDKEEITRICNYYNENKSYASLFSKSKDLGIIADVIPLVQQGIPALKGSLINAWTIELQQLITLPHLNQVTKWIPKVNVRLIGIKNIPRKDQTVFSFAFNFIDIAAPIKVQGISILSFGVDLIVSDKGPSGKGKLLILKNNSGSETFTPLKKAS
jgi:hypothetical protein